MYHASTGAAAAGAGGALAATGANVMWAFVAAFTLFSAGLALRRIMPARTR
ncbi:hypothetical protein [Embleya hyalina]|uniref:Uncharacterized protein n=1 Tax=Embleya hyalina TaxID=516124 RepID=A0A401YT58_9ACTN|nr:hypothetical protein [Embleya hyalina]GCD97807.1 hypothetical protein EHYA_05503 [Embleya hyalina]